ncbi:MAG TPA: hypothetical protein DCQ37_16375 [Desulfobacteraceae bacterium]|jgi:hypothetical protein|nr:hypothetical protein [Desulfobacteraceae bacterium]
MSELNSSAFVLKGDKTMMHTLMLEVPENLYEPLSKSAQQTGLTIEELALKWLMSAVSPINDPLENFIGAFSSNVPDWSDQHDKYLSQNLMNDGK